MNEVDLETDARAAADAVMRCFDTSAAHHHADEEADLFPALLEAMPGSDPVCLRELVEALCAEHRRADPEIGGFDLAAIVGGPALCLLGNAMSGRASSLRLPPSHVVGVALLGVVAIVLRSAPALLPLLATMVVLARVAAGDWLSLARLRLEAQGGALREGQANLRPPRGGSQ